MRRSPTKRNKTQKPRLNAPFVILKLQCPIRERKKHTLCSTSASANSHTERKNNFTKKKQVAIKFLITVLLFGLFVIYENLIPILQRLLENSTSFNYSKILKKLKLQFQNCREKRSIFRISVRSLTTFFKAHGDLEKNLYEERTKRHSPTEGSLLLSLLFS